MTKDHNFSENQDTQPIDSLPSSPSDSGEEKDGFFGNLGDEFMNDTVPFEDDAWINDEFKETQVIDNDEFLLCRETQAVDLGFQTQEEPFVEDEQLLQGFDGLATQVLDPSDEDSDDVDVTVFLVDNREVSDCGDSSSRRKLLSSEDKSRERADENMKPMGALDAPSSGHENVKPTGKVARFASVRSAAFRASAVSAQKLLNRDSPTLASCHSSGQGATTSSLLQQHFGEVGNQNCPPNTFVEKKNEGKRTARKLLFEDDSPEENCPSPGLSYIDSQEPGEASQASALKFVDKLISESGLNFDVEAEADYGRRTEEKLDKISSVKGPLELAKKASYKARALGNSMFEWDDNREDEGGGDICLRRKEELFGAASKAQRRSSVPREQRRELEVSVDKSQRRAHSDSRLLQRCVTRGPKMIQAAKKNLGKELDAVSEEGYNRISDMRDLVELGYETQVAAEAVDAVRSGGRSKVNGEASPGNKLSPGEERVITRQSKGTKRIQAMGKEELLRRRMNKASPSPAKACRKSIERSLQSDQLDKGGPYCSKRRIVHTAPRESRDNLVDEMDEVSKESKTRMFNRREEVEAGPDTQMAAEVISALHSGDARDEAKKSSRGVVTRKSKRLKGIQAVDDDIESLKPKTKKAKSVLVKAYSKNEKLDLPDEVVVSKLLKQPSGGEADVLSYPKRRRSARFLQDQVNEAERSSEPDFDTPVKSKEPSKNVSPICMGDEYHRLSCKDSRTSNTTREFRNLTSPLMEPVPETKSTRKRRDLGSVRVLFSQHLDEDVTKHQKKDLYILRDSKKEKEFGFNMGVSLARARQNPLLKGRRVFITPNTKPGLNTITTLVKAVHGQPVERVGRSVLSDEKVPENLLVLSCEEDRDISVPFLERGAEVYSSELVLNGIVTQKLEYERYRLFTDRVRRTRSTIWIRDGKGKFQRRRG
ncbi:hypothetical protein HID58_067354 [Brassica napus]|uniref:BRCT domain-containing protein n=1 Tax=Brassica napus TaxID=3708 RepID=A0ABQ7ZI99_BRANA|nr:hypothetical protein HID58_067354 [Brassica napus]